MYFIIIGIIIAVAGIVLLHYIPIITEPRLHVYLAIAGMAGIPVGIILALAGAAQVYYGIDLACQGLVSGSIIAGIALLCMHYDSLPGIIDIIVLVIGVTIMIASCIVLGGGNVMEYIIGFTFGVATSVVVGVFLYLRCTHAGW